MASWVRSVGEEGEEAGSEGEEGESGEEGGDESEEGEAEEAPPPKKSRRPASAASGTSAASGAPSAAGSSAPRLDASRILTPKDFERIKRLRQQQQANAMLSGAKRKRAEAAALEAEMEEAGEYGAAIEGEAVDLMAIEGVQARRNATREDKLASTLAGREGRVKFGSKQKKKTGGSSNKEKKKSHPFQMASHSNKVRTKAKRREETARKNNRRAKTQFRGKVKR